MAETRTFEPIVRPVVPALDEILGQPIRVLDEGFVRVVDYMGDDSAIVQAARVSYGKGTKRVHEDRALIRYLMRHDHTTPFEMCEIKLHVRVPMDIWRQWIRHRTANVNEYSTRYSEAIDAAQRTAAGAWRTQSSATGRAAPGVLAEDDRARGCPPRRRSCRTAPVRCTRRGWRPAWPASRRARTCRWRPSPRPTGRSTCTTCCTSSISGWTRTRSWRSANTPRRSASRSWPGGCRWPGRRSATTAAGRPGSREPSRPSWRPSPSGTPRRPCGRADDGGLAAAQRRRRSSRRTSSAPSSRRSWRRSGSNARRGAMAGRTRPTCRPRP